MSMWTEATTNLQRGKHSAWRQRHPSALTLIELLVVVVVIGIISSMAMTNYVAASTKAKLAAVMDNMHTTQTAAEAYATDSGGLYPAASTALGPYFPGGANTAGGSNGYMLNNPFSNVQNEAPAAETVSTTAGIQALRATPPPVASPGTMGQTCYNQCDGGSSYCITGADNVAHRIARGAGGILVFSNQ